MNQKRVVIFLIISIFFLLSILLFTSLILLILYNENIDPTEPSKIPAFQTQEINVLKRSTNYGFSNLPRSLSEEDHISYFNKQKGSTVFITPFGGSKYECIGSCYCSVQSNRRASNIFTRGASILLTAFSSTMALQFAKETFENHCVEKYSESCDSAHIISEVEDCSPTKETEEHETEVANNENINTSPDNQNYHCQGHCICPGDFDNLEYEIATYGVEREEFMKLGYQKIGICEKLTLENVLDAEGIKKSFDDEEYLLSMKQYFDGDENLAIVTIAFAEYMLDVFCRQSSQLEVSLFSDHSQLLRRDGVERGRDHPESEIEKDDEVWEDIMKYQSFCMGIRRKPGPDHEFFLDNLKCIKI